MRDTSKLKPMSIFLLQSHQRRKKKIIFKIPSHSNTTFLTCLDEAFHSDRKKTITSDEKTARHYRLLDREKEEQKEKKGAYWPFYKKPAESRKALAIATQFFQISFLLTGQKTHELEKIGVVVPIRVQIAANRNSK